MKAINVRAYKAEPGRLKNATPRGFSAVVLIHLQGTDGSGFTFALSKEDAQLLGSQLFAAIHELSQAQGAAEG